MDITTPETTFGEIFDMETESEPRFWALDVTIEDGHPQAYGSDTVGIVDEEAGGVILYCHELNASRIIAALIAAWGN